jgi:hypothetical protein
MINTKENIFQAIYIIIGNIPSIFIEVEIWAPQSQDEMSMRIGKLGVGQAVENLKRLIDISLYWIRGVTSCVAAKIKNSLPSAPSLKD